jgi:hypothetical protein
MAIAFDRWKHYDTKQKDQYLKMSKKEIDMKTLANGEKLEKLAEIVEDKENVLDHLNN